MTKPPNPLPADVKTQYTRGDWIIAGVLSAVFMVVIALLVVLAVIE